MLDLYKNIKARREELGLTQAQLAEKIGYADKTMISKIEKGSVDLSQSKISTIAEALRTTLAKLMGWEDTDSVLKIAPFALPDTITTSDGDEYALLTTFRELNKSGKNEVIKRAYEVSRLPEYTEKNTHLLPVAAHSDDESPDHLAEDADILKQAVKKK